MMKLGRVQMVAALLMVSGTTMAPTASAFSTSSPFTGHQPLQLQQQQHREGNARKRTTPQHQWTMYLPPAGPTSQTPPMTAQKMLKSVGAEQERGNNWKLSQSVLASCDTLPSFRTAPGLLSPATVSRLGELVSESDGDNEAVVNFLDTYQRDGPMSCLYMLSDPNVLPHLTEAMREIR